MNSYVEYINKNPINFHTGTSDTCNIDIHIHDKYEVFQALSDNIRYYVEGSAYNLSKGDLVITSNKEIHRPTITDNSPYGRRFVQFDPLLLRSYTDIDYNPLHIFENRKLGRNNHIVIPEHAQSVVNQYFLTIEAALINPTPRILYESRLTLMQLIMEVESLFNAVSNKEDIPQTIDPRIYDIRQYLDQHYTDPFDHDLLSRKHLMDKFYLSHLFKENTGFTLLEYVQSKRILLAKNLLKGEASISSISQQCGYEDYSNFYKTFKKLTKMSPKEYRATLSN